MSQLIDNLNLIVSIKSDIKSAIENKGVDMTGVSFGSYADKIGEISGGGGVDPSGTLEISENGVYDVYSYASVSVDVPPISGWDQKSLTEGTNEMTNLDNTASFVASYAFAHNKNIQTVNLPYATSVGTSAFDFCWSLTNVNLPMCSYIGSSAFADCYSLSQVSIPVCSYIDEFAFASCSSLTQISLPVCSYIGFYTFYKCSSLSQISLPVCSYIGSYAFKDCTNLNEVNLPVCSFIGSYAFNRCSSLSQVNLPVCSFIGNRAFYDTNLTSLTLGSNSVVSLSGDNQFFPTDILSIYVPGSLYSQYITNHKWISYSSHIVEPLIWYDNGTLGGSITEMSRTDWESLGISGADIQRVNFNNAGSFSTGTFKDCTNLSQVNLNNWQLTESEAFMGCTSLESITHTDLHQGRLILGDTRGLFSGCTNLSSLGSYVFNSLGDYMFAGTALTSYKLYPYTNYIGNYVFQSCTSLTEIDLKDMKSIVEAGTSIFDGCTNLSVIYINNEGYRTAQGWSEYSSLMSLIDNTPALSLEDGLLYGSISAISRTDLTELRISPRDILYVSLPNCTSVSMDTFRTCFNLTSISLPMCENLGSNAFQDCESLSQVSLPMCSYIGNNVFVYCNSLTQVSLPVCSYIGENAFYTCESLSQVSLPVCSYIGENAFQDCSLLSIITIGYSGVCSLAYDVFNGTPIAYGTGSIYVPASLVDAYKTAENWSMYLSQIFTIPS